ncbi:MAG: hypothetical protein AAGJ37_07025 [Pseudomonadota bacterium]
MKQHLLSAICTKRARKTWIAIVSGFSCITLSGCDATGYSSADKSQSEANAYAVTLEDKSGNAITVGTVTKHGNKYEFERDDAKFKDFFLSMKEMKCLEGPEILCHIHYPYPQEDISEDNNLEWLSHELLFMYKRSDQFGARLNQGVFFALSPEEDGFTGTAYGLDLNDLASPPDSFSTPPIELIELEELEIDNRWLPFLKIKPI